MKNKFIKNKFQFTLAIFIFLFNLFDLARVYADTTLPPSILPGVLNNRFRSRLPQASFNQSKTAPEQTQTALDKNAQKITFKLTKIILSGNVVYSSQTLKQIYQKLIGKQISIAELQKIVQNITNFYRNNGYILSRAILPPQKIENGVVKIQIIEGFISQINVIGSPWRVGPMLQAYGKNISASRPLQLSVLEHYLKLSNEIPGTQVKGVLEPSKKTVGASDLNLVTKQKIFMGYLYYSNTGTRFLGPQQLIGNFFVNSMLFAGDMISLGFGTSPPHPKQIKFYDISYSKFIGSHGLKIIFDKNYSATHPAYTLEPLKIEGLAYAYSVGFAYPLLRSRTDHLDIDGKFNYMDSSVTSLNQFLYMDHLRTLSIGGYYLLNDRFNGTSTINLHFEKGLSLAGGTTASRSALTSRFGATSIFSKITTEIDHKQIFNHLFIYTQFNGQYAREPLLASEQFSFGGVDMGAGYDSAELIGDRGVAGRVQVGGIFYPGMPYLIQFQPFVFYDQGISWNIKPTANTQSKYSAASTGLGLLFKFNKNIGGQIYFAQPLTRPIESLEAIGRGRKPRLLFSLLIGDDNTLVGDDNSSY